MRDYESLAVLRRQNVLLGIARSRIPKEGIDVMGISSYIASLTNLASVIRGSYEAIVLPGLVRAYGFLRDRHGCSSVGDAMRVIEEGLIDRKVVNFWVEEGYCLNKRLRRAIDLGYPDLSGKIVLTEAVYRGRFEGVDRSG